MQLNALSEKLKREGTLLLIEENPYAYDSSQPQFPLHSQKMSLGCRGPHDPRFLLGVSFPPIMGIPASFPARTSSLLHSTSSSPACSPWCSLLGTLQCSPNRLPHPQHAQLPRAPSLIPL